MARLVCVGIESTAHTLGVGIVDSTGSVLANQKHSFFDPAGIHPSRAADHLAEGALKTYERALEQAEIREEDIGLVAFSRGPGMGGSLRVGATAARALAVRLGVPIVGVNHCIAHISIGLLKTSARDPIVVYVSGGNSQVAGLAGGRYRVFGETLDIGIGNMLDKFAREFGLGFPGGPRIQELGEKGSFVGMPYVVKGMDFSFSGLYTAAVRLVREKRASLEDVCYSLQEHAYSMVTEVTERALAHTRKNEVLLTGGVAASRMLREKLETMCRERGATFHPVPIEFAMDNGAMIAWQGLLEYRYRGADNISETTILPKWRTDEVEVSWEEWLSREDRSLGF